MAKAKLDPERQSLNKWEMHKVLQALAIPGVHVPETRLLTRRNVQQLLAKYGGVYVKPTDTWGGQRVSRITGTEGGYAWTLQGASAVEWRTFPDLWRALQERYAPSRTIVQAAAPILSVHGRPCDVRLLLQREVDCNWVCAGAVARVGGNGSIVSNVEVSHGEVLGVPDLCDRLDIPGALRASLEARMERAGLEISTLLDPFRSFNEIGIDFGVAKRGVLWIIEVNTDDALGGPSHELFAHLPDTSVYEAIQARAARVRATTAEWLLEGLFGLLAEGEGEGADGG
ncbi:MAG: YheC/YheD family protein [Alicyclobacillus sp.]|nr:YheC/YheD family protein [Alicyclobacillus sp.]